MPIAHIADAVRGNDFHWTNIENVLPVLHHWSRQGQRVSLVTLVGIDGASPRGLGAQIAVSETGEAFGHISGGCLRQEVINKALSLMEAGKNECIRYGAGSKYIDIVLPCGSGLDLYFDQEISSELIAEAFSYSDQRRPFLLKTNLDSGASELVPPISGDQRALKTELQDGEFVRVYRPKIKLAIMGTDPAVLSLARLGAASDMDVKIQTSDQEILETATHEGFKVEELVYGQKGVADDYDPWTASVMLFHDHNWEVPLLQQILETSCFYIGAQGSWKTHEVRVDALKAAGVSEDETQRIHGPIGIIERSKSPAELAISALADIVDQAKKQGVTS